MADLPKQAEDRARTEAELRAEIRSLKGQLSARPTQTVERERIQEKRVEVPVLKEKQADRLVAALAKVKTLVYDMNQLRSDLAVMESAFEAEAKKVREAFTAWDRTWGAGAREAELSRAQRGADRDLGQRTPGRVLPPRPEGLPRQRPASPSPADLPPAKQRILNALASGTSGD